MYSATENTAQDNCHRTKVSIWSAMLIKAQELCELELRAENILRKATEGLLLPLTIDLAACTVDCSTTAGI